MKARALFGSLVALAMSGALVIACGDDDDSGSNVTPDGGTPTPDAGTTPGNDGSTPGTDGSVPDGAQPPQLAPITPVATTRIANAINPYGLVFASDGNLYASGATMDGGTRKLAVWRFKDGALDTTFGTDGVITTDLTGDESSFDIVEVSPNDFVVHAVADDKVWLVKLTNTGGTWAFGTPKFVKFGYDEGEDWPAGTVLPDGGAPPPPSYGTSWGIALDKSNTTGPKIVVFASGAPAKAADPANQRTDNDRWITRVDANTLEFDTTFNGGKPFSVDADGKGLPDNARRGIVLSDGSIVSAGYTNFGQGLLNHVVLIRLLPTGAVDPAFGFGTSAPTPGQTKFNPFVGSGGFAEAYGVAQQSTGRYVTTGYGVSNFKGVASQSVDLVSFGVKPDGLDTTYGEQGSFAWQSESDKSAGLGSTPFEDRGRDIAVLPDDRIVHVGRYDGYATVFVLDQNGKPDTSFGLDGMLEYQFASNFYKVALSPDGKQIATTAQSVTDGTGNGSLLAVLKVGQ